MQNSIVTLSQTKLIQKLWRDKDIDYIAFVTSSWHFLSALSTITWLKKSKQVRKGIILICEHPAEGQIIEVNMLNRMWFEDQEIYTFRFATLSSDREVMKYIMAHDSMGKPFYILRPVMPKLEFSVFLYNCGPRKNIIHVVLEEGMASYMRDWKGWLFEEKWNVGVGNVWKQFSNRTWKKFLYTEALKRRGEFIENTLFILKEGKFLPNKRAITHLKRTIEELKDVYDFSKYNNYGNSVIICTQPYGEQNYILKEADIKIIRECCRKVIKKGYRVIIKPHPREKNLVKYDGMGAEIDVENAVPLEAILAQAEPKPKCIIGITTTTLVTAQLFWKIPAFSIARLIEREAYSRELIGDIDNYCKTFSGMIKIPQNIQSIID